MIKKLEFVAVLSILLLSGCGGGDSTKSIADSKVVVIMQNVESGYCETSLFKNALEEKGLSNVVTKEVSSGATCADYGKIDGQNCGYTDQNEGNRDCIIGSD